MNHSFHCCLDSSRFTSLKSLIHAYLTHSSSLVELDTCNLYFFSFSFELEIKLKVYVKSITRTLAPIQVNLNNLSLLCCIYHIIYVLLEHIFLLQLIPMPTTMEEASFIEHTLTTFIFFIEHKLIIH